MTAIGGHFVVKLDGKTVLDYTDPKPLGRGLIGLQFNSGKIEFRDIKLKPLGLEDLLAGNTGPPAIRSPAGRSFPTRKASSRSPTAR